MTLMLTNADIAQVLRPTEVLTALDAAYSAFARGQGVSAPRIDAQGPGGGDAPTYQLGVAIGVASAGYAAVRIKSDMVFVRTENGMRRKEKYAGRPGRFLGLVLLFDAGSGDLVAILHDGLIQQMRVGADSALGVRYMARPDARRLAILGSGGMAGTHLACISAERRLERVRVFSPTSANRDAFAQTWRNRGLPVEAVDSVEAAVEDAEIIASCTNAIGPVVLARHLAAGQHVVAIGGTLDAGASARIDVALRFGSATAPEEMPDWNFQDECLSFAPDGKAGAGGTRRFADVPPERRITLADLISGRHKGRSDATQITFSERGNIHGLQFAAVAGQIYETARAAGLGMELPPDMFLEDIRN
ncbi:MAG: ornithine cyclodeaminase family protein [Cypionkella sp.]